jgi:Hsp20/alpha crystallin family
MQFSSLPFSLHHRLVFVSRLDHDVHRSCVLVSVQITLFVFFLNVLLFLGIAVAKVMPGESFEVKLDVQKCKKEDITVSFDDNGCLVVQTRKCLPGDNSIVARKFSKRVYPIELSKFDKSTLQYDFDDNGMLNIQIHPKAKDEASN